MPFPVARIPWGFDFLETGGEGVGGIGKFGLKWPQHGKDSDHR